MSIFFGRLTRRFPILTLLAIILFVQACKKNDEIPASLEDQLNQIPGFSVTRITPSSDGFLETFEIRVTQPVDHDNPNGPKFEQKVYLKHTSFSDPVVLNTRGYRGSINNISEFNGVFSSNYIGVEHRYYGESTPANMDWQYLTVEQAAADHHHIVESLKPIYTGKWMSTGGSKGGMSALFHKRFYPEDVDASVVFVAPVLLDLPDTRLDDFLNTQGSESCRNRLKEFQRMALTRRDELVEVIVNISNEKGYAFAIGPEAVLEYSVIDYLFAFWQYHHIDCQLIPDESATAQEIFDHLNEVSPILFYEDRLIARLEPFFYQSYTQTGMYYPIDDHLDELITVLPEPRHLLLAPRGVEMVYDNALMLDISNWLKISGDNIIYIYGENDPFTAAAVNPDEQMTNSKQFIQKEANHLFRLNELEELEQIYQLLEDWMDIEIN